MKPLKLPRGLNLSHNPKSSLRKVPSRMDKVFRFPGIVEGQGAHSALRCVAAHVISTSFSSFLNSKRGIGRLSPTLSGSPMMEANESMEV